MSLTRPNQTSIGHNGQQENLLPVSAKALQKIGLFKKTDNLVLYKKSERICAAAFVISDAVASEALRERIRSEALNVFSGVRDAIGRRGTVMPSDADRLALGAVSLASILELACRVGEITESNYALMRQECVRLAEALADASVRAAESIDPRILESGVREPAISPEVSSGRVRNEVRVAAPVLNKGHIKDTQVSAPSQVSFKGSAKEFISSLGSSIEDRESKIIDVVKGKGKVSIKDITDTMPEVGEKTIQRALISLVTRGVLKKEGERRWSRYALAQATLAV
jgi:hypothetical protein